ncbi:MAG TPA: transglutaminase domain-containing protein [Clostridiales bacterium]|nr:transglutaminase domain-containing protein [Clostridiales bacterium]
MYPNLKKGLLQLLAAVILIGASGNASLAMAKAAEDIIDTSELENGIVIIGNTGSEVKVDKVRVIKGGVVYTYDYENAMRLPLQSGSGEYQVVLYSLVKGTSYKQVASKTVNYTTDDETALYLQSNHMVTWDTGMRTIKKAAELTKGLKTDSEKADAIYNYIVNTYEYDSEKAKTVRSGYIPSIDNIFTSKKGICYDYSVSFAAMLRSVGIPAQVIMGQSKDVEGYHAWNQVYLKGKWVTVDTTFDAGVGAQAVGLKEKKEAGFTIEKRY